MKRHIPILLLLVSVLATAGLVWHLPAPASSETRAPRGLFAPPPGIEGKRLPGDWLELSPRSVSNLKAAYARLGYSWRDVSTAVPRVRLSAFPADLGRASGTIERKRLFYQAMVPLILMENERVRQERAWLTDILARTDAGRPVSAYETAWVEALARRQGVKAPPFSKAGRAELMKRVDGVPPSLALAMAALESGWGTSRFAGEGNNLFGHWTFRPGTGLVPKERPDGARYELAVFPDLASSFRAYLRNLNTHWAYADFREARAGLKDLEAPGAAETLAASLVRYSTRGQDYIDDLVRVIRRNHLTRFDRSTLHAPKPTLRAERLPTADAVS